MPPGVHAALGASSAHRWRMCPGSIRLSEGMPDYPSAAAAEGTVAHDWAEECLTAEADAAYLYPADSDKEMAEHVQTYVDYVRAASDGKVLLIEQQFDLSPLNPPGPMFGTADAVVWDEAEGLLEVIDLKYGKGVIVDAIGNDQGLMYSLGAVIKFGRQPERIRFTIVQPRVEHPNGGFIRSWEFSYEELVEMKKELFVDAEATVAEDAPLLVGSHCRWCKAQAICPAQQEQVVGLAQDAFAVEPTFPERETLTLEDMAEVVEKAPAILAWIKSIGAHLLNLAETGVEIPGHKLVTKRTNRQWVDEEATEVYLRGRRLKKDERYNLKLISPAQAEKILKKKSGPDLPDRLVTKPEGGVALAPLDDKRPARVPGAQEAFGVLTAETSKREEE